MRRIVHYVTFLYPGSLVTNEATEPTQSRDPNAVVVPSSAFAFSFHDREEHDTGERVIRSEPFNHSGTYYPDGTVYTLAEIVAERGERSILARNMASNNWKQVVRSRAGNYQPFNETDVVYEVNNQAVAASTPAA